MMNSAVTKHQRMKDELIGAGKPVSEVAVVKEESQVMEVVEVREPAASPELGLHIVASMRKVREAMYPTSSLRNADFRELVVDHKLTQGESLLKSVDLVLRYHPYNARSVHKDVNDHYIVLTIDRMVDVVDLCERMMTPEV